MHVPDTRNCRSKDGALQRAGTWEGKPLYERKPGFHSYSVTPNYLWTNWHHTPLRAASSILTVLRSVSVRLGGGNLAFSKAAGAPWWRQSVSRAARLPMHYAKKTGQGDAEWGLCAQRGVSAWERKT